MAATKLRVGQRLKSATGGLLGAATLLSPARGQDYTLWDTTTLVCISGGGFFSCLGIALEGTTDHDGDGVRDLYVGDATYHPIYFGGRCLLLSGTDGTPVLTVTSTTPYDRLGWSIAVVGDVNGDGVEDVVVGAPQIENMSFGPGAGYAKVFSGADGAPLLTVTGSAPGDRFGWSVSRAGDLTGEGVPDFAVGALSITGAASGPGGYVRVHSGSDGSILFAFTAATPAEMLGASLAGGEDLSGDGIPDLLVGNPKAFASQAGEARIYSGATGALLSMVTGTTPGDDFGWSVALAGDLDGDGIEDYAVGAPVDPLLIPWGPFSVTAPYVRVFSGSTNALLFTLSDPMNLSSPFGAFFGHSVAAGRDVNGDAVSDIVVGTPYERVFVFSGEDGTMLAGFQDPTLDYLGVTVELPGDLNGDGFADLVASSPAGDPHVRAYSWVGIPTGSSPYGNGCPGSGGIVPNLLAAGGLPTTSGGNPAFGAVLTKALAGTVAVLVLGTSFQSWGGVSLPLDLTPFGVPGCFLLASGEFFLPAVTTGAGPSAGMAVFPLSVPASPALSGAVLHLQAYVVDPGPVLVPGSMTRAIQVVLP